MIQDVESLIVLVSDLDIPPYHDMIKNISLYELPAFMTSEATLSDKIKCKICGFEVPLHKYHGHIMAMHCE
jgi:hypothetical protein